MLLLSTWFVKYAFGAKVNVNTDFSGDFSNVIFSQWFMIGSSFSYSSSCRISQFLNTFVQ